MKVIKALKQGSSAPLVVEQDDKLLLVKLRTGMSGEHGLITEYLGSLLGKQLGLPTLIPTFINIDESLDTSYLDIEIKDLVNKSQGLNLAFDYQAGVHDLTLDEINSLDTTVSCDLFLFDIVMLNIDRTDSNPNLIGNETSLYSIDYESSLIIQELLSGVSFSSHPRILQQLRNNPLYQEVESSIINAFITKLNSVDFSSLLSGIPESVLSESDKTTLLDGISLKKDRGWSLDRILDQLKQLTPQSAAELKARNNENQSRFKKNFEGRL